MNRGVRHVGAVIRGHGPVEGLGSGRGTTVDESLRRRMGDPKRGITC